MGVRVKTVSTKFFNEFYNDVDFLDKPLEFTNNLTGSVKENIKLVQEIEVEWFFKTKDSASTIVINAPTTGGPGIMDINSGDFIKAGFSVDDFFSYEEITNALGVNMTAQITAVSQKSMSFNVLTGLRVNGGETDVIMRGTTDLTASIYKFGLIENAESFSIESKVSGNDQGYYAGEIGERAVPLGPRDTNFVDMIRLGQFKGWQTGSMRIRFVSDSYNAALGQTAKTGSQRFEIEHEFTIVPWFLDGQLTNLQNNVIPEILNGLNSLKYAYSPGFRTVLTNPNTEKVEIVDGNRGSVAWYGESFNSFQNNYKVVSVSYEEAITTDSADGLLIGSKTRTRITVEKIIGSFSGTDRFGAYISYLPKQIEYQGTTITDLKQNFIYDNALNNAGLAGVSGKDFITDLSGTIVAGKLEIVIESEYSSLQKAFLSNKFSQDPVFFQIEIQVGDVNLSAGNSDRVMLLADVDIYDESADIPGLFGFDKFDVYTHPIQIGVGTPSTDAITWVEDGLVIDFDMTLDLNKQAVINSLVFKLVAFNPTTEQLTELDSYNYQIFPAVVSGGIQQLISNTTRGYLLDVGDQFNDVTISTVPNPVAGIQHYVGRFAQKISWQDWVENLDIDTIFFDPSKLNNNRNNKASNYSFLNGYEIRLNVFANVDGVSVLGVGGNTNYAILNPRVIVNDYDEDGNVIPIWSGVLETFNPLTLANLSLGMMTGGASTLVKGTWTNTGTIVAGDLPDIWAIHRIQPTNSPGSDKEELSSINSFPAGNKLIPIVGETQLKISLVGGEVITECFIDGSQLDPLINYDLSARIEHTGTLGVANSKLTEVGDFKITEEGDLKIPE